METTNTNKVTKTDLAKAVNDAVEKYNALTEALNIVKSEATSVKRLKKAGIVISGSTQATIDNLHAERSKAIDEYEERAKEFEEFLLKNPSKMSLKIVFMGGPKGQA